MTKQVFLWICASKCSEHAFVKKGIYFLCCTDFNKTFFENVQGIHVLNCITESLNWVNNGLLLRSISKIDLKLRNYTPELFVGMFQLIRNLQAWSFLSKGWYRIWFILLLIISKLEIVFSFLSLPDLIFARCAVPIIPVYVANSFKMAWPKGQYRMMYQLLPGVILMSSIFDE